jgi:hypothetical protein
MSLSFTQPMGLSSFFAASQRLQSLALMIQSKTVRPQVLPAIASIQERAAELPVLSGARIAEAMAKGIAGISAQMVAGTIARHFLKCPELSAAAADTAERFAETGGRDGKLD